MGQYFYDVMKKEDLERLPYLPTIADLMEKCKKDYETYPAISDKKTTYTYGELYHRVARRRSYLASLGLKPGDRVAVMGKNTLDTMELYLAVTTGGYTVIMLPNALNAQALAGISRRFELSLLIAQECFLPHTEGVACRVVNPADAIADTEAPAADVKKDTVAAIYFTGGTTGAPKGAILTHGALMRGALNGTYYPRKHTFHSRFIAMLPLSHIFGSLMSFLSCLYTGGLIYTCEDMRAAIGDIPVVRPNVLVLVPGLAEIVLNIAKMKGKEFLGDLDTIACGAAPVPPRLMADFRTFGISLLAGYGLTEGANLTCGNFDTDKKPDSMGKVYPCQEYKVVNGELWIRGDNVMVGYYKDSEKTAEVMEDGWLKTGDLVEFDEDGYIYIVGRIKNLIILSNGENVSPEEIEEVFYRSPFVHDCLVSEDSVNGQPAIAIEIRPYMPAFEGKSHEEIEAKLQEVVNEVNRELPTYKRVAKLKVRYEDFKRTGAMKIARN